MSTTFADLGVPENITAALAKRGIEEPFEIQAATIADSLAGRDVCGPRSHRLGQDPRIRHPAGSWRRPRRPQGSPRSRAGPNT